MERLIIITCGFVAWLLGAAAFIWAITGGPSDGPDTTFVWMIGVVIALLGGTMFQLGRRI